MTETYKEHEDKSKTRVISYARFSSHRQAKGSSIERQDSLAKEWCKKEGYTLDVSLSDKAKSAFSGANTQTGAFAALQQMLSTGEIARGTILIVEALDRITRQDLPQAVSLMMNLLLGGLTIVTVGDGKRWTSASLSDLPSFLMSVMLLYRGHEESKTKSERLRRTFRLHRDKGSQSAFGTAPGWLHRADKNSPWIVDEEKAAVVRRVFELSAAGFGSKLIAAKANDERWPVPTRLSLTGQRWHAQMAGRILNNRVVLGEHQHRITTYEARSQHWKGLEVGEAIKNYYPQIVSNELWLAARASISARSVAKRRDSHYYNVFSGLNYCGFCGAPIHRKNGTKGYSRAQLTCADRIAGLTKCGTMSARNFDAVILQAIYEHSHEIFVSGTTKRSSDEIAALEVAIADNRRQADRLAEALASSTGSVKPFLSRADFLEREYDQLSTQMRRLQEENVVNDTGPFDEAFVQEAMGYLYLPDDEGAKKKRAHLNLQLSRIVETIWIFGYDCAFIKFKDQDETLAVPLPGKRLPSRANPLAKWHVTPKERAEPLKSIWAKHLSDGVMLPQPRRPKPTNWQARERFVPMYSGNEEQ